MRRPVQRIATFLSSILLGSVRLRVLHNHWTLDFARHSSIEIIVSAWQQQINWRLFCEKPFQINQSVAAAAPLKGFLADNSSVHPARLAAVVHLEPKTNMDGSLFFFVFFSRGLLGGERDRGQKCLKRLKRMEKKKEQLLWQRVAPLGRESLEM